jgi:hypothetical protein
MGDNVAALLQGRDELWFSYRIKPAVTCRHTGKASCVRCTTTFVCFQEINFFTGKRIFFKYAVIIKFVAVQYTTFEWA